MKLTVQLENYKEKDGSLTDAFIDFDYDAEKNKYEVIGYETKTFALLKDEEVLISEEVGPYKAEQIRYDKLVNLAIELHESEGLAFFNNLIYKDLGGSW